MITYGVDINPELFKEKVLSLHPSNIQYEKYWREQKSRCINGYWQSGRWMPGQLYFYINFGTIKLNKKGQRGVKQYAQPELWDIVWEFFYNWSETVGFSGFPEDPDNSCHRGLLPEYDLSDEDLINMYCKDDKDEVIPENYFNFFKGNQIFLKDTYTEYGLHKRERKTYINARDYLRRSHPDNYGFPLYLNENMNMMMMGSRGFGKDLAWYTKVPTSKGVKLIKDIEVGDTLYGRDGKECRVTNTFKFTDQCQYRVTFSDRQEVHCGLGHKWLVYDNIKKEEKRLELKDILKTYKQGKRGDTRYFVKLSESLEMSHKELSIDPYLLGVLIGDGGLTQSIVITTADEEIINNIVEEEGWKIKKGKGKYEYFIRGTYRVGKHVVNPILDKVKELGLYGKKSENKFIPEEYLYSHKDQRIDLLQGLMDTDGYINKRGNCSFSTSSPTLAKDFVRLVRSLGIRCSEPKRRKTKKLDSYRISILTSRPIFKIKRKLNRLNLNPSKYAQKNRNYLAIRNIEKLEVVDSYCLSVDSVDSCFLVKEFIPTSNSYSVGVGIILHQWLFDGIKKYNPINPKASEATTVVTVGAGDAKYSTDLLQKTKIALDYLPGGYENNFGIFPAPFYKNHIGTWNPGGRGIVATYKKKLAGSTWKDAGSFSSIKHRTFKDNPFAANGLRSEVMVFEEMGMFDNLIDSYNASVECMMDGAHKFGSAMFLGTGGDFQGGGTRDAYDMCYNPRKYRLIEFDDTWEQKGKICYFVPAYLGLRDFKDKNGITNIDKAMKYLNRTRKTFRDQGGTSDALNSEIQNRPLKPSEMFLAKTGNIFPIAELKERLTVIEKEGRFGHLETKVHLRFDSKKRYGVTYDVDNQNETIAINKFPWNGDNREGAVVIYEFPLTEDNGTIPQDTYVIGHDPYRDDHHDGPSLASIYVYKTKKHWQRFGHDEIVAQFVGRPYIGREKVNEILMKLSMFYGNAKIFFEKAVGNTKEYFEKNKRLDLLAPTPSVILSDRPAYAQKYKYSYGYPMNDRKIKLDGLQYIRDLIMEEREMPDGTKCRNLDRIWDRALLQEMIAFDLEYGNYDRVMGFMGCAFGVAELFNKYENAVLSDMETDESLNFLINNQLFKNRGGAWTPRVQEEDIETQVEVFFSNR